MSAPPHVGRSSRVLVARLDSLGDVLLAGPAVRAVARCADVTMLVRSGLAKAAELLPGVDDVVEFDAAWVLFDPPPIHRDAIADLLEAVEARHFDAALVLTSFHQSPLPLALLLRLAQVPWIGAICEDYPGSLLDLRHHVTDGLAESERYLSLARAAGFPADQMGARLAVRQPLPDVTAWVGTEPYVVFHPGAAVPARRPTATHSRAIVAALLSAGHRVIVTGSADETTLTGYVAGEAASDLGGQLSMAELAAVLGRADVVVAPNTGPAHLAAAVGTPVVSLFAPVVAASQWAPYGVPRVLLGDQQAPCRGTRMRACTIPDHPCLTSIRPSEVVAAVAELQTRSEAAGVATTASAAQAAMKERP
ncbi:MAG TPA: glycosyltransferase family 9 protein [Propionibacteriaceae bacterium]